MLSLLDRGLAIGGWLIAGVLVLMLFAGPQLVAEDEPAPADASEATGSSPYAKPDASPSGDALFAERCGTCHTFGPAGTSGQVGPPLDGLVLAADEVEGIVRDGRGGMPAFGGELSAEEVRAVAEFVTGGG